MSSPLTFHLPLYLSFIYHLTNNDNYEYEIKSFATSNNEAYLLSRFFIDTCN